MDFCNLFYPDRLEQDGHNLPPFHELNHRFLILIEKESNLHMLSLHDLYQFINGIINGT